MMFRGPTILYLVKPDGSVEPIGTIQSIGQPDKAATPDPGTLTCGICGLDYLPVLDGVPRPRIETTLGRILPVCDPCAVKALITG